MEKEDEFLKYSGKEFRNDGGELMEGDIFKNGIIMRFHNGLLDGQGEPAIETNHGHIEYWEKGQRTRVVTDYFNTEEIWENGKMISSKTDRN